MLLLTTLSLPACLIDRELYERRRAELADEDGDGYTAAAECDDADAAVHPDAVEVCDGVDQDCDGEIDEDAGDAATWFADADGDGHGSAGTESRACDAAAGYVASDDDCDEDDATVHPGAGEVWYDGTDQDCAGDDDDDADGDGDRAEGHGGTDCDDDDPTISGTSAEGWVDAGIDNNCDGSVEDPAVVEMGSIGVRIEGTDAGSAFGTTVTTLPAGWADDEAVLLVAAPLSELGDVYGWRASDLGATPTLAAAPWHVTGTDPNDYTGFGVGWAGDAAVPLVAIGVEGAGETRGVVQVWRREAWGSEPTLTVEGEEVGGYLGGQVVSGYDHDGDGSADLLVSAHVDSRAAVNGGASFLFLGATTLEGVVSTADADLTFTTTYASALLSAADVGDVNGDGLDDLGFTQDIPYPTGPGGLLVTGPRSAGSYDVVAVSDAQIHGGPLVFSQAWDPDADGASSVLGGTLHRFDLPLLGSLTPWEGGSGTIEFEEIGPSMRWLRTDSPGYGGHTAFVAVSPGYAGAAGMVSIQRPVWSEGQHIDDAPFLARGDAAGDNAGWGFDFIDLQDDDVLDLAVGAPGADRGGAGSGAVYLLPAPR